MQEYNKGTAITSTPCAECPLRDVCDIKEIGSFLNEAMPPEVFKLYNDTNAFDVVRLSNKISEQLISLLRLKIVSFKDLYFSKRKFPVEVFPSIEFVIHTAHTGLLKWGYWIRNLAAANYICKDLSKRTTDAFKATLCKISKDLPKLLSNGELLNIIIGKLKNKYIQRLESKVDEAEQIDFYDLINWFFSYLYDFCDILTYIIVSFSIVNKEEKDKIVYIAPCLLDFLEDYLNFFLKELPEKGIAPTEICVTNPSIRNDVKYFVRKINPEIEITLC